MTIAYIALGSNLATPEAQLALAIAALADTSGIRITGLSRWYWNPAVGPGKQPDYLNGVLSAQTSLGADELLSRLQEIETQQGRERNIRWSARTLDLDLLLYGDNRRDSPHLTLPHPRLHERNFVLIPLMELAPGLLLPNGTSLRELALKIGSTGLRPFV